jgi:hypothetical protein
VSDPPPSTSRQILAVRGLDGDLPGVFDHVIVGDDIAVGRDKEAGTRGVGRLGWDLRPWPEEARQVAERTLSAEGQGQLTLQGRRCHAALLDVDRNDGGRDALNDVCE